MRISLAEKEKEVTKAENKPPKIPKELECSICTEVMKTPTAVVPCMHTFCQGCLLKWQAKSNNCPMCTGSIKSTQKNIVVQQFIERLGLLTESEVNRMNAKRVP